MPEKVERLFFCFLFFWGWGGGGVWLRFTRGGNKGEQNSFIVLPFFENYVQHVFFFFKWRGYRIGHALYKMVVCRYFKLLC